MSINLPLQYDSSYVEKDFQIGYISEHTTCTSVFSLVYHEFSYVLVDDLYEYTWKDITDSTFQQIRFQVKILKTLSNHTSVHRQYVVVNEPLNLFLMKIFLSNNYKLIRLTIGYVASLIRVNHPRPPVK